MPKSKKSRSTKTSAGINKHKKNPQTPVALVLMGKGLYRSTKKI